MNKYFAHQTAIVDEPCEIGEGTKIWHYTHIREGSKIGSNCIIGQNCYIDNGVQIGDNVKIQNGVSIYKGITIEDNVFIGPNATFTNDKHPKALGEWHITETVISKGASIGANATIVCGICVGEDSLVGAGSVVCKNVMPKSTVVGNPAKPIKKVDASEDPKIKVGVIGAGKMGKFHIKTVAESKNSILVGFYDICDKAIANVSKKYPRIRVFNSIEEMFSSVDAVIIASPSQYHYEHALKALNNNIHVLCEKPLTLDYKTSLELLSKAKEQNLILQPGQVERHNPAYKALRKHLNNTKLLAIETSRTGAYSAKHSHVSIAYDLLVHDLDLIVSILQEDLEILSVWGKAVYSSKPDIVSISLKSLSGILVSLLVSRVTEKRKREYRMHLLDKYIESDLMNKIIKVAVPCANNSKKEYVNIEQQTSTWISGADQLQSQFNDFLLAIEQGKPAISYTDIKRVAKLLSQITETLNRSEKIDN